MTAVSQQINKLVENEIESLVKRISIDYKISLEEMKQKYELMFITVPPPQTEEQIEETPKKQRGRKKKVKDDFISTTEYMYNGVTYLLDSKNNVYTYNIESPTLIGEKLIDGTIKFVKGYVGRSN